jgi:predicted PurR-regulated permease PerM
MLLTAARGLTDSLIAVILSLIVATMFWASGDKLAKQLHDILGRLGGATAERTLDAAGGAVRSVAYGVIGTAVIQSVFLALGLAVAGVPGAVTLGFLGLLLAISQIGGPLLVLVWGGAAWWLFSHDYQGWGVFMIGWGLLISTMDNVLKPWLIGLGVHMPMSLTILGVFGGFITYGFLGLFIGPTLIAVALVLLEAWRAPLPAQR